jgi:hypothetical protein
MVESNHAPSNMDKEIHDLLNQVRANPKMLLPHLETMLSNFNGEILKRPGKVDLLTKEGTAVVHETIEYLKK